MEILIDASALKESACLRRFNYMVVQGYRESVDGSYKAAYGNAMHRALKAFYSGENLAKAIDLAVAYYEPYTQFIPQNEWRTPIHLIKSIRYYYRVGYPFKLLTDNDNKPVLEVKFKIPYLKHTTMSNITDIYLVGTIDLISDYEGTVCLVDHKTHAPFHKGQSALSKFFKEYELSIQGMFYSWCYNQLTKQGYLPLVINGLFLYKNTFNEDGKFDGLQISQSQIITYPQSVMEEFITWAHQQIGLLVEMLDAHYIKPNFTCCNGRFYPCKFFDYCKLPEQIQTQAIEANMQRITYNPLAFQD